jgi:ribose transport system ATP-binding protein
VPRQMVRHTDTLFATCQEITSDDQSTLMNSSLSTATPRLELRGLTKSYGSVQVLSSVGITVAPGEVHALVGENGAGKSTLLKIMSGLVRPDTGSMSFGGQEVDFESLSPSTAQQLGISVVHQEFALLPAMTVAENIFLGREPSRFGLLDRRALRTQTAALLSSLGSDLNPDVRVEKLGVADCQVVEIAKALSFDARLVAMDEPSAVLSGVELENLFEVIKRLSDAGVSVLYVSHRMDELFKICQKYSVIKDGVVVSSGAIADTNRDRIVSEMVGRDIKLAFPPSEGAKDQVRLSVRNLVVPGLRRPVDLDLRAGEVVGVAGLGGSGRTRLAKALFGSLEAVSGEVSVDGRSYGPFTSPAAAIGAGVAYVPEDRKTLGLALSRTVAENSTMFVLNEVSSGPFLSATKQQQRAGEQIEEFSIKTHRSGSAVVGSLSGGNQQKVVFAKWLASQPKVLILDEPTRGIDVGSKEQIYSLIRQLSADGAAILLISSELVEVLGISDRILVMSDGAFVGELEAGATEEDVMELITKSSSLALEGLPHFGREISGGLM